MTSGKQKAKFIPKNQSEIFCREIFDERHAKADKNTLFSPIQHIVRNIYCNIIIVLHLNFYQYNEDIQKLQINLVAGSIH